MEERTIKLKNGSEADIKIHNPDAFPTGTTDMDDRIEKARKDHRWVKVGEYSEEWQKIVLLSINGLSGLEKIRKGITTNSTGGVKIMDGQPTKTDDATMFIDALDNQLRRLNALKNYFNEHMVTYKKKPISPSLIQAIGDIYDGIREMTNMNRKRPNFFKRILMRFGLFRPSSMTDYRDMLLVGMQDAGFRFKIVTFPIVGEKYEFKKEVMYKARPKKAKKKDGK